jgi:hypothetical protein
MFTQQFGGGIRRGGVNADEQTRACSTSLHRAPTIASHAKEVKTPKREDNTMVGAQCNEVEQARVRVPHGCPYENTYYAGKN